MAIDPARTAPPSTFGALLQRHRLAAGLSQEALAERAGVSARAISDLERGARQAPYPHTVRRLAQALRLSARDRDGLLAAVPPRHGTPAPAPADGGPPTNLPAPLTSFVGRERELDEARRLLATTRLLTLYGTGGVGKTRLALELARAVQADHPDGVWLVELAALVDPGLVPQAAARALGLSEQPGQPVLDTLAAALRAKRLLQVLDNCEHLLHGCAALVDALLRAGPGLRVLAVSREPLAVAGEVAWPTPPLALPDPDHPPTVDALAGNDAIRLFVERAAAARPSFALTPANAAAVARLCARLDGIPLALELAAARVRGLPPEELAARLDDRFRLLTAGSRAAPPRQQTLRATVDWSYYLLTERERVLLRRLAVFAGGWTIAAAEAVGAGDGLAADEALDVLLRLVDKSLVVAEERPSEPRYRLLETVRQYAWERLREAGEEEATRARHAAWRLALAERAEPELHGPEQVAWLDHLDVEHDNLRAALEWCLATEPGQPGDAPVDAEAGLRLAGASWWFWYLRHRREGVTWVERALARSPDRPTATRARVLCAAGTLHVDLGDIAHGRARLEESAAMHRSLGDKAGLAYALSWLGRFPRSQGLDYAGGTGTLAESLRLAREVGDRWLIARALMMDACTADLTRPGEVERAQAVAEESLALFQATGDLLGISMAQRDLGEVALSQGDYERARTLFAAVLAPLRALGDSGGVAMALRRLGNIALAQGDPAGAVALHRESVELIRAMGGSMGGPFPSLERLAMAMIAVGQPARGARLLGATDAARRAADRPRPPTAQPAHEATMAAARAALGEEGFAAAWAEGQALTLDEAIADALADEPEPATVISAPPGGDGLTPRAGEAPA